MESFKLNNDIMLDDLAIYIKSIDALVFGDLHIGYEENLHKEGFLIPKFHFADMKNKIYKLIKTYSPKNIVLMGDIKHQFQREPFKVNNLIIDLLKYLTDNCENLYILKGNHEKLLKSNKLNGYSLLEQKKLGDYFFCHGDIFPKEMNLIDIKTLVIGHAHPAIKLYDYSRKESFKCFLKGKFRTKDLIVLPSFNLLTLGIDIVRDKSISPFIEDIGKMEVFVVGKEILDFGKVSFIRKKLDNNA